MKKNSKSKTSTATKYDHPGRPRYTMKFPTSAEWTFTQLMARNGVETDPKSKRFGKGEDCTMLTLRKNMEADMYLHKEGKPLISKWRTRVNARSQVVLVEGVTAEPDSESGLGRRALLYRLRSVPAKVHAKPAKVAPKAKAPRKARTPKTAPGDVSESTKQYEEIKAILAAPTPAVTITPTPEVAPVIPTAPAPVAVEVPAPAPEAPAAEVVPVAETPALTPVSAASLVS